MPAASVQSPKAAQSELLLEPDRGIVGSLVDTVAGKQRQKAKNPIDHPKSLVGRLSKEIEDAYRKCPGHKWRGPFRRKLGVNSRLGQFQCLEATFIETYCVNCETSSRYFVPDCPKCRAPMEFGTDPIPLAERQMQNPWGIPRPELFYCKPCDFGVMVTSQVLEPDQLEPDLDDEPVRRHRE